MNVRGWSSRTPTVDHGPRGRTDSAEHPLLGAVLCRKTVRCGLFAPPARDRSAGRAPYPEYRYREHLLHRCGRTLTQMSPSASFDAFGSRADAVETRPDYRSLTAGFRLRLALSRSAMSVWHHSTAQAREMQRMKALCPSLWAPESASWHQKEGEHKMRAQPKVWAGGIDVCVRSVSYGVLGP